MKTATLEQRMEYNYTSKNGAKIRIKNVPMRIQTDEFGKQHRIFSIAVAMRLEELRKQALMVDDTSSAEHLLEF